MEGNTAAAASNEMTFDFEKSLWDNVVLQSMNTYVKIEEAIAAANKVITARRQMFNDQGEV